LSVSIFEKTPISTAFMPESQNNEIDKDDNQLLLFNL
jgi:hypothetical protein